MTTTTKSNGALSNNLPEKERYTTWLQTLLHTTCIPPLSAEKSSP
jgi:hypothetical protein